jgi:hypothetical protein
LSPSSGVADAPRDRLDAFGQQAGRAGLPDEVVGADVEADHLVDLVVFRGQEDGGQVGRLAQLPQQLHAVHLRHLHVENGDIRRVFRQAGKGRGAVMIGADLVTLCLEEHFERFDDVLVVVHQGDGSHPEISSRGVPPRFTAP